MKEKYKNIYFLGIGGIGMSALAKYFKASGFSVAGYDRFRSDLCVSLEEIGIEIHYQDDIAQIPEKYKNYIETLIILTPAIPSDHNELNYFLTNKFQISKRAQVLGLISNSLNGLAIAGTHGKTSVSGICANIMSKTKESCSAFLGGISKNINSNLINNPNSKYVVVEADEFDRSFHQLNPSTALITCIEADHLDIYGNYHNLLDAFIKFGNLIKQNGNLILNNSIDKELFQNLKSDINLYRYGLDDEFCDFNLTNISYKNSKCFFDIISPYGQIKDICYQIGGNHNLENALAAASVALLNDASEADIRAGLEDFKGIVRRFDYVINTEKIVYIDDYAHHPGEIKAFLDAVKLLYPSKRITGVFQPHLFSRTADFFTEFADSLSVCDELILLPIYPAREKPIEGIDSEMILKLVSSSTKTICQKSNLIKKIQELKPELIVTMGAGDIDLFVKQIKSVLEDEA